MRCRFTRDVSGWSCGVCGRRVRIASDAPPIAVCGQARQPSEAGSPVARQAAGPGTELSKLLKRFGFEPTPTCQCRAKAAQMDAWGCDECSRPERIEEVVAVMREEATKRGLPFLDAAGRMLVKRAIKNARRLDAPATVSPERTADGSQEAAQQSDGEAAV